MNIEEQKKLRTMLMKEAVGKAENATAKAIASRHRARESAYGESKQERTMADHSHKHRQ